jgi:hypothetical protein
MYHTTPRMNGHLADHDSSKELRWTSSVRPRPSFWWALSARHKALGRPNYFM